MRTKNQIPSHSGHSLRCHCKFQVIHSSFCHLSFSHAYKIHSTEQLFEETDERDAPTKARLSCPRAGQLHSAAAASRSWGCSCRLVLRGALRFSSSGFPWMPLSEDAPGPAELKAARPSRAEFKERLAWLSRQRSASQATRHISCC